jgi:hypothetical protein
MTKKARVPSVKFITLACGLVLDTVTRGPTEMKRLRYLNLEA